MYTFKHVEELAWVGLVALATFGLELAFTFDPDMVMTDWRAYAVAAGAGALRAFAGAVLARMRPQA